LQLQQQLVGQAVVPTFCAYFSVVSPAVCNWNGAFEETQAEGQLRD